MIDVQYIVDMEELRDNVNGGIVFTGFKKSKIVLDKSIDRWKVVLLDNETTILVMADKSRLPIGPNEWVVPEDVCRDGRKTRSLVLTSCNETEFSCDDGICIPIQERLLAFILYKYGNVAIVNHLALRCDGDNQCNDGSDEKKCQTLYWGEGKADSYTIELGPENDGEAGVYRLHGWFF